jgi:hypothetical protein
MKPDRLDRWIRRLMTLTVLAVATFAFTESYSHIYGLGKAHHETGVALRMLPLSVDWLILAAGLVLLHESRRGITLGRLSVPRNSLLLGIAATLAANVAFGLAYGWEAALISAWAPVVLVLTVEMGMHLVRSAHAKPETERLRGYWPLPPDLADEENDQITKAARLAREAVTDSPGDPIQGWGQLGGQQAARPGLDGIGLANGRK